MRFFRRTLEKSISDEFLVLLTIFINNGCMCEYFHELMLLNGHYPTGDIDFGVFNMQVFSKTSLEGHGLVALTFFS